MQYFVIAPDGSQYGPATLDLLKQWAQEGRLDANTALRDVTTQAVLKAGSVPGLFPSAPVQVHQTPPPAHAPVATVATPPGPGFGHAQGYPPSPSGSPYLRPDAQWSQPPNPYTQPAYPQGDTNAFWRSLIWSGLAIVFFFALRGIGLIVGASAIFYGYRAMTSGHKLGMLAFVISIVAVAIIAVGWFIRLKGGMQY